MSEGLSRMRHRLDDPAGLGNAGLASSFVDLGHCKVKLGGTVALVLPAAAASGKSWRGARDLLKTRYRDITVASLAVSGSTTRAFSADTGMADILIVATRTTDSEEADGTALFANLLRRPASLFESSEIARAIRGKSSAESGKLHIGDRLVVGYFARAQLEKGGCVGLREEEIANTMVALQTGSLRLPRMRSRNLAVTVLDELEQRGMLHRDINGADSGGHSTFSRGSDLHLSHLPTPLCGRILPATSAGWSFALTVKGESVLDMMTAQSILGNERLLAWTSIWTSDSTPRASPRASLPNSPSVEGLGRTSR